MSGFESKPTSGERPAHESEQRALGLLDSSAEIRATDDRATAASIPEDVQDTVQPLAADLWVLRFTGLRAVRVSIQSPAPHSLTCRIIDSNDRELAVARTQDSLCALAWTPARTGAFRVEIRNPGMTPAPYVLKSKQ